MKDRLTHIDQLGSVGFFIVFSTHIHRRYLVIVEQTITLELDAIGRRALRYILPIPRFLIDHHVHTILADIHQHLSCTSWIHQILSMQTQNFDEMLLRPNHSLKGLSNLGLIHEKLVSLSEALVAIPAGSL